MKKMKHYQDWIDSNGLFMYDYINDYMNPIIKNYCKDGLSQNEYHTALEETGQLLVNISKFYKKTIDSRRTRNPYNINLLQNFAVSVAFFSMFMAYLKDENAHNYAFAAYDMCPDPTHIIEDLDIVIQSTLMLQGKYSINTLRKQYSENGPYNYSYCINSAEGIINYFAQL